MAGFGLRFLWGGNKSLRELQGRLQAPSVSAEDVRAIRRDALKLGLWPSLAAEFPQQFRECFELKGDQPATAAEPFRPVDKVSLPTSFPHVAGKSVFVRVQRATGRVDFVAGEVESREPFSLKFRSFEPVVAERLAQVGDSPFFQGLRDKSTFDLGNGDRVLTVVELPVAFPAAKSLPPQRRISLRERGEAVAGGAYAPRVDLTDFERHLVRNPATGEHMTDAAGFPVFTDAFVEALRVEQNTLLVPLAQHTATMMIEKMREPEVIARFVDTPLADLFAVLHDRVTEPVVHHLEKVLTSDQANTALGKAYANLQRLLNFTSTFFQSPFRIEQVSVARNFIWGGANTSMSVCALVAQTAGRQVERDPSLSISDLVRSARPLIMRLAASHQYVFTALLDVFKEPDAWELAVVNGEPRLQLSQDHLDKLHTTRGVRFETLPAGTTGCPAAQSLHGMNAVNEIVGAFVELMAKWEAHHAKG